MVYRERNVFCPRNFGPSFVLPRRGESVQAARILLARQRRGLNPGVVVVLAYSIAVTKFIRFDCLIAATADRVPFTSRIMRPRHPYVYIHMQMRARPPVRVRYERSLFAVPDVM